MSEPVDPNQSYGIQPYPAPGYPVYPPPAPPGYPGYPGYSSGSDPRVDPDRRPGLATSAAILGFVSSGLLIVAGLLLLMGASFLTAVSADLASPAQDTAAWLAIAGTANLIAAGLAVAGGISLLARKPLGRVLLSVAAAIDTGCAIGWLTQGSGSVIFTVTIAVPMIVAVPLMWLRAVSNWLRAS
jgi:hypothetical protein